MNHRLTLSLTKKDIIWSRQISNHGGMLLGAMITMICAPRTSLSHFPEHRCHPSNLMVATYISCSVCSMKSYVFWRRDTYTLVMPITLLAFLPVLNLNIVIEMRAQCVQMTEAYCSVLERTKWTGHSHAQHLGCESMPLVVKSSIRRLFVHGKRVIGHSDTLLSSSKVKRIIWLQVRD